MANPNVPNNFFGNFNILGIVLEIPRQQIQSRQNNPNLSAWIRVLTPDGNQFDRMGRPGINTVVGISLQGTSAVRPACRRWVRR